MTTDTTNETTWYSGTWAAEGGTGAYADINGLHLYVETHGPALGSPEASRTPLVLLHGGLGSGEMFAPVVPVLMGAGRPVITVDLQAHGRTADIDRPLDPAFMGDD